LCGINFLCLSDNAALIILQSGGNHTMLFVSLFEDPVRPNIVGEISASCFVWEDHR